MQADGVIKEFVFCLFCFVYWKCIGVRKEKTTDRSLTDKIPAVTFSV